jgi:hypothetical protein
MGGRQQGSPCLWCHLEPQRPPFAHQVVHKRSHLVDLGRVARAGTEPDPLSD